MSTQNAANRRYAYGPAATSNAGVNFPMAAFADQLTSVPTAEPCARKRSGSTSLCITHTTGPHVAEKDTVNAHSAPTAAYDAAGAPRCEATMSAVAAHRHAHMAAAPARSSTRRPTPARSTSSMPGTVPMTSSAALATTHHVAAVCAGTPARVKSSAA